MAEQSRNGPSRAAIQRFRQAVIERAAQDDRERRQFREALRELGGLRRTPSAREAILQYLQLFVGLPVHTRELAIVSGIGEYARRIRELRVEFGYDIASDESGAVTAGHYILFSPEPDRDRARAWQQANLVRNLKISARDRILEILKENVGRPLPGEMLRYVAKISEYGRRARELRTELGWRVVTKHTGRPELRADEYLLESLDQLPPHDRKIPAEVYESVLERDHYACRRCSWESSNRKPGSKRQFLELHHREHHAQGGQNEASNLLALCNLCHDAVHSASFATTSFDEWLAAGLPDTTSI